MSEFYPLPAHAASVWIAGDTLWIAFPGEADARGHTVPFPANEAGLQAAFAALKARASAERNMIGSAGAPSRHQVERALRKDVSYQERIAALEAATDERKRAERELEELGL